MLKQWATGSLWIVLWLALTACFSFSTHAQSFLPIYGEQTKENLTPYFDYLWEEQQKLSIEDVLARNSDFKKYTQSNPNFGFSDNALWLRITLNNLSEIKDWVLSVNFSQNDYIDFYLVDEWRVVKSSSQGKRQTEQRLRLPTFSFSPPTGKPVTVYIRVEGASSSLIVPATLLSNAAHTFSIQLDSIAWGLFYGGLLILVIYNMALFFSVREFSLVAYIIYILTVLVWQFVWGGHVQLVYENGQPEWFASHTDLIFTIIGVSSGFFTLSFLEAEVFAKKTRPIIFIFIAVQMALGFASLLEILTPTMKNNLVYGVGVLAIVSYMTAGFEAFFNKFKPAWYFITAWSLLATGAIVGMLSLVGILPSNTFTTYCFQVGVFLEAGLFSVALMEKSRNQLQSEVEQATNDLRNNMEVIEEQNARLDIARKDAIKASNIKSQFLANMSHEIRTPLNAILGFSRELRGAGLATTQKEQVKIINSAADNLLTIVNDVLDFSKIEAGKLQINNTPFSPMNVFEEMVAIMAQTAHQKGLDFVFHTDPLPDKIISDEIRLKQVLTNLIGNALKFTSQGSVSLFVTSKLGKHGVIDLCFDVIDTGIGISRTDRKKLFSAFSQVDDTVNRNYQGTGLGLVISQELVRLMNGSIQLRSQPGIGSTFSVTIRASHIKQRSEFSFQQRVKGVNVVVFDPFPESRQACVSMLQGLGATVTSVDSLTYLQSIESTPDFLMIFLSNHSRFSELTILQCAMSIKAKHRIVWYSDEDPLLERPLYSQTFDRSESMPATPNRLYLTMTSSFQTQTYAPENSLSAQQFALPALSILAVDDMEMNLILLETWFNNTRATLTTAYSGEEAVKKCQSQAFDMILMDVQMPGMDGLQASREIRKTPDNKGTPIIAVTAHAFKEEQERLLSSGMDDYLPKPVAFESLMQLVKLWCDVSDEGAEIPLEQIVNADWELALERADGNTDIAKRLLAEFKKTLPAAQNALRTAAKMRDLQLIQHEAHRLHGACCYTGAPIIQKLASSIELSLKRNEANTALSMLPKLYSAMLDFENECNALLTNDVMNTQSLSED